jgi:hypothetical protein
LYAHFAQRNGAARLPALVYEFIPHPLTHKQLFAWEGSRVIVSALLSGLEVVVAAINRQEKILQIAQLDLQARGLDARVAEMRWFETETSLFQYAQGGLHQPPPVLR